jgi:hypothetical protein
VFLVHSMAAFDLIRGTPSPAAVTGSVFAGDRDPGAGMTGQSSSKAGGGGGWPATLVTIWVAMVRSLTLRFCEAARKIANASASEHRS